MHYYHPSLAEEERGELEQGSEKLEGEARARQASLDQGVIASKKCQPKMESLKSDFNKEIGAALVVSS